MKPIIYKSALASIAMAEDVGEYRNPALRYVSFIYCDDQPNGNNQGVEYDDFDAIAESAINTPIKMRYLGRSVGNHVGSIPIGHITKMEKAHGDDGRNILYAHGIVYADEFPGEVDWLEEKMASASKEEGEPPYVSYEMHYDSVEKKNGIDWLKGVYSKAVAFVRNPAYGTRTALLALASNAELNDEEFSDGLIAIANDIRPKNTDKGGNITVEDKEREEFEAKIKALEEKVTDLTTQNEALTTANASLTTANEELTTKVSDHETKLAEAAKKDLIVTRTQALADAGVRMESDPTKLAEKQEVWASMPEETFTLYIDTIKDALKDVKPARPSLGTAYASATLPKIIPANDDTPASATDLKSRFRGYAREIVTEENE